ncbi:hypothetical protein Lal_00008217 [Lupinus albus]|uniref:Putative Zinc finger, ZZ-type, Zinc finger, RING/FYVE/PHD-type n=1 Tax=Lupinus albus TaxID=3870 RepID=A0A6A4PPF0_LUPAL|nr:putative Zinc finger, ZZ-type, Zinc finger, RING/FYVE/PHD-type [Lupinus albus]KAF1868410.1 hypothetical protein Lal_00008217 [Lupinus albus]
MENNEMIEDENEHQNIFESFVCCVCLDLLYKPTVLSCGHISCFWCVHKSMDGLRESHCPICRNPYYYFPTICQMLHFLLLKIYPDVYKRRENRMLEEEKKMGLFSPQFDACTCESQAKCLPSCTVVNMSVECMEQSESATHEEDKGTLYPKHSFERTQEVIRIPVEGEKLPQNEDDQQQRISVADVMCTTCKQLLFRPVVLNCGHVYCETCIVNLAVEVLKCEVCQSLHPKGFPKVCLALDHFLEEQFPEEYAKRRDAVQLSQLIVKPDTTSCSMNNDKVEKIGWWWCEPGLKVHTGVGCDFCGMYPIIGDRYRCMDCKELIGFDLCGDCYNTRSKRPGRFNQQHTPEHKFQLIQGYGIVREQLYGQESSWAVEFIPEELARVDDEEDDLND